MTDPMWAKSNTQVDAMLQRFTAGDDVILDREFFLHDIRASRVHVEGLERIGILSADEALRLDAELATLAEDFARGAFVLDGQYEDGHSAIEVRLTERFGDVGRKVHTGRSRNDQVLVATRLWLQEKLQALHSHCVAIASVCLARAQSEALPMPGYTHLQRAVVSSTAMWHAGFAEAFIDNAVLARDTCAWIDANPLGTAAGYGVNLPLDREHSTRTLGFGRMQLSPIYAQLSRGKFELAALHALGAAVLDLRRLAWDLSLFTTAEFGFVRLPDAFTTGSSIMPNKRNPDVIELMRASYAPVAAARTEIEQLLSLPSGYQRDLQYSKGAIFHGFRHGLDALALLPRLLTDMQWNADAMRAAIDPAMHATDLAIERATAGVPFREAYRAAMDEPDLLINRTPETSLAARVSPGGAADLRLDELQQRLTAIASTAAT
jgi:argininosuccinate lyase